MLAMYGRADQPNVKWFTGEFFNRGCYGWTTNYTLAKCPLVRDGDPLSCLNAPCSNGIFYSNHGPQCFSRVCVQNGDSTWVLTGEYETRRTFIGLEGWLVANDVHTSQD